MAESLDQEVQTARRRPVLYGLLAFGAVLFAVWYMTGGSATGSPHQAEQVILANSNPYGTTAAQTVHCTQNSQSLFARLRGLIGGGGNTNNHPVSTDPSTVYTCSGTSTTGQ